MSPAESITGSIYSALCDDSESLGLSVDKVRPPLQHLATVLQIKRRVISATDLILIDMGQLSLNPIGLKVAGFI